MRTLTTAQTTLLALPHRAHHVKVEVYRTQTSTWVSLNELNGYDWVMGVTISESIDQPVANAVIKVRHRIHNHSLNPLFTASPENVSGVLLKAYKQIRIYTATMPHGTAPASTDYVLAFRGRIDKVDLGREDITLDCRDEGGDLMSLFIEVEREYGSDAGTAVQTIAQEVLDNNSTGVTLYSILGDGTPAFDVTVTGTQYDPAWSIKPIYTQPLMSCLQAVRDLFGQIGWDVRYRWQSVMGDFLLVAYKPVRSGASVDYTISSDLYMVDSLWFSNRDVRNVVEVRYKNANGNDQTPVTVTDATSITNNGRLYMRLAEAAGSQIDTSTEATLLANAALSDLVEPTLFLDVTVPYFFAAQLNDYYTVSPDGVHLYAAVSHAVHAITHEFGDGAATTKLSLSGAPKSGRRVHSIRTTAGGVLLHHGSSPPFGALANMAPDVVAKAVGIASIHKVLDGFGFNGKGSTR